MVLSLIFSTVSDDITSTRCGRVCNSRRGLHIHKHTCLNKEVIDTYVNVVQKFNQHHIPTTAHHHAPNARKVKIIEPILKNNKNEYISKRELWYIGETARCYITLVTKIFLWLTVKYDDAY